MTSQRISVRISAVLERGLRQCALTAGKPESELVREALQEYLSKRVGVSAYDLAREAGLIGCFKSGAKDLSTTRRHFRGFGER